MLGLSTDETRCGNHNETIFKKIPRLVLDLQPSVIAQKSLRNGRKWAGKQISHLAAMLWPKRSNILR